MKSLIGKLEELGCSVKFEYDETFSKLGQGFLCTIEWDYIQFEEERTGVMGADNCKEQALLNAAILLPMRLKRQL